MIADFWNNRYSTAEYIYGEAPNEFFKSSLGELPPGKLFLPAEGEGRNAVHAALQGWDVSAYDWSTSAKAKAEELARKKQVHFTYTVGDLKSISLPEAEFDAAALIYLHLLHNEREIFYEKLYTSLKPGGILIFEAFSQNQLGRASGGPQDLSVLYTLEDIITDFIQYDFNHLSLEEIELQEGNGHSGPASVIRFIGKKV